MPGRPAVGDHGGHEAVEAADWIVRQPVNPDGTFGELGVELRVPLLAPGVWEGPAEPGRRGAPGEIVPVSSSRIVRYQRQPVATPGNSFGLFEPFSGPAHLPPVATGCAR